MTQQTTPGAPYDFLGTEKTGWLSRTTFESLPERFREGALELYRMGEIEIEDMPLKEAGAQKHGIGTLKN